MQLAKVTLVDENSGEPIGTEYTSVNPEAENICKTFGYPFVLKRDTTDYNPGVHRRDFLCSACFMGDCPEGVVLCDECTCCTDGLGHGWA